MLLIPNASVGGANFFDDLFADNEPAATPAGKSTPPASVSPVERVHPASETKQAAADPKLAPTSAKPPASPSAKSSPTTPNAPPPTSAFEDLDVDALQHSPAGRIDQLPVEKLKHLEAAQQLPPTGRDPFAGEEAQLGDDPELDQDDVFGFSDLSRVPQMKSTADPSHAEVDESVEEEPIVVDTGRFDALTSSDESIKLEPIDDDDPLSLDNLTGAPQMQLGSSKSLAESDPFADDPDAPLRIEGISESVDPVQLFSVRCTVCDSRIMLGPQFAGTQVTCPDCFSRVDVPRVNPPPAPIKQWNQPLRVSEEIVADKQHKTDDELKLSRSDELPDEYGLAPIDQDLLKPRPTDDLVLDEEARAELAGHKPLGAGPSRINGGRSSTPVVGADASSPAVSSAAPSTTAGYKSSNVPFGGGVNANPSTASNSAAKKPGDKQQYRPSAAKPENTIPTDDESHRDQQFPIELGELWTDRAKMSQWVQRLLTDPELILRAGGAALMLAVSYWFGGMMVGTIYSESNEAYKFVVILGLGLFGVLALVAAVWLGMMVLSLIFQLGTEKFARYTLWPGFGLGEWGGAALYVAFSLWLTSLPGLLVGLMFFLAFDSPLALVAAGSVSILIFQPILLSHAFYNGSPWAIFSRDVMSVMSTQDIDWLRYLPGSLLALVGVNLGFVLMLVPGFLVSLFAAVIQILCLVIYFSTTGLYCHLMAEKVELLREKSGKK